MNYIDNSMSMPAAVKAAAKNDKELIEILRPHAEKGKCALSSTVLFYNGDSVEYKHGDVVYSLDTSITNDELAGCSLALVKRAIGLVDSCLQDAGISKKDISQVLLVGGTSRLYCLQTALQKYFGFAPNSSLNPDTVVSKGAAFMAGQIMSGEILEFQDLTPLGLGIVVIDGTVEVLIPANTPLPAKMSRMFYTTEDYQRTVSFPVVEGNGLKGDSTRVLTDFTVEVEERKLSDKPHVTITFCLDQEGESTTKSAARECKHGTRSSLFLPTFIFVYFDSFTRRFF